MKQRIEPLSVLMSRKNNLKVEFKKKFDSKFFKYSPIRF